MKRVEWPEPISTMRARLLPADDGISRRRIEPWEPALIEAGGSPSLQDLAEIAGMALDGRKHR